MLRKNEIAALFSQNRTAASLAAASATVESKCLASALLEQSNMLVALERNDVASAAKCSQNVTSALRAMGIDSLS